VKVIQAREEPQGPHDPDRVTISALRIAAPSFEDAWRDLVADWQPDDVPVYVSAGAFAQHPVHRLETQATEEFPVVFAEIERLLREGDAGVRYLVTWGLLEDIGNVAANDHGWPFARRFREWFGHTTTAAWDEVHRRWGSDPHDPRAEFADTD